MNSTDPYALIFHDEAAFYFLYLKFYILNQREQVFNYIQHQNWDTRNNHLFAYLVANLSLNNQDASVTEEIISRLNRDPGYLDMPTWDMQMGYAKADRLDRESVVYLERFIGRFKGKFYVKDVLQKISWIYYLQGETEKAEAARARILILGSTETDADKQALKEAESGRWPNETIASGHVCLMMVVIIIRHFRFFQENRHLLFRIRPTSWNIITGLAEFTMH